jgi:hypothetical protein
MGAPSYELFWIMNPVSYALRQPGDRDKSSEEAKGIAVTVIAEQIPFLALDPWLCVPTFRWVCLFRMRMLESYSESKSKWK